MTTPIQTLIHAVDQADSPERLVGAVQALATAQEKASIPALIKVLGYNNPGAAAIAVKGLVQLGRASVQPLLDLLDDYNYGARAWAIRALVAIADPLALEVLLSAAATDFAPSVRRAATKGLGMLHWHLLSADQANSAQSHTLETLLLITQDSDWSIRYAAVVGLQGLAIAQPALVKPITDQLQPMVHADPDLAVQARVRRALDVFADRKLTGDRSS